jgi:hypothetical protein
VHHKVLNSRRSYRLAKFEGRSGSASTPICMDKSCQ